MSSSNINSHSDMQVKYLPKANSGCCSRDDLFASISLIAALVLGVTTLTLGCLGLKSRLGDISKYRAISMIVTGTLVISIPLGLGVSVLVCDPR